MVVLIIIILERLVIISIMITEVSVITKCSQARKMVTQLLPSYLYKNSLVMIYNIKKILRYNSKIKITRHCKVSSNLYKTDLHNRLIKIKLVISFLIMTNNSCNNYKHHSSINLRHSCRVCSSFRETSSNSSRAKVSKV